MVCIAIRGEPVVGVIHKPFSGKTAWGWYGPGFLSQDVQDDTRTRTRTCTCYLSFTPSGAGDGFFGWGTGAEAFCGGGGASCGGEKQSGPGYCGGGECAGCGARSYFF